MGLAECNDGFVQASLRHDWQFATDRLTAGLLPCVYVLGLQAEVCDGFLRKIERELPDRIPAERFMSVLESLNVKPEIPDTGIGSLPGSFSPATVKQEQRIGFEGLRRLALAQLALRRLNRFPDPLPRIVG